MSDGRSVSAGIWRMAPGIQRTAPPVAVRAYYCFCVQLSCRCVVKSKAIKASDNLRLVQSRKKRIDFQDAIDTEFERCATSIASIAATYSKKPDFVRTILCSLSQFKNTRAPTLRNAVVHQRALDYQAKGISKKLQVIREELQQDIDDGAFSLDTIEEEEVTRLLEHRKLKRKGAHATTKAVQIDAKQTTGWIGDMVSCVCGVAFFSRGNADDPLLPNIVDSNDAMDFLTEGSQISPLDFLRKFERWVCTREGGNRERNSINNVRKDVSTYIQDGLRKITNNPNVSMEYVNYDVAIREAKGIELAGVPSDVKVDKHADWNMTKSQHEALVAELNAKCEALGASALKKRKPRADKDQPRGQYKKRAAAKNKKSAPVEEANDDEEDESDGAAEKEAEGVQPTPRTDSTVLAPGAGASTNLSVTRAIPSDFTASSTFAPFTGSSTFIPSLSFDLAYPDKVPDYNPALNNLSFDPTFPTLNMGLDPALDPVLHLEFDPALLQLLQDRMAVYNPDSDAGTSRRRRAVEPRNIIQYHRQHEHECRSLKRKRGPKLDNSGMAQPAKKARKQRGENALAAQGMGDAPAKKPRKVRSDKDKVRGPRKSKAVAVPSA
ncbi:hypothetical protein B0H13DRAFT_2360499 [Mycena leptocephala]|nr:hypothetical protein B0H13DRAFT_2360499 [Mycena leptocephala]